jgi:PKD repeat protein
MSQFRLETAFASRLARFSPLVLLLAAFSLASVAEAQVVRPSNSVYLLLRGGVSPYYGDLADTDDSADGETLDAFEGFAVGGEIGYLFNENLSLGLGFLYHDAPGLNDDFSVDDGVIVENVEGGEAYQGQLLFRYMPFASARISPFVELGGAVVSGQGTESERAPEGEGDSDEDVWGYGPVVGLGFDIALTPQFSVFLAAQGTAVFPDVALDGADPGASDPDSDFPDDADFDVIGQIGGGLKFAFRPPYTAVEIESLQCPSELIAGETGSFMAMINDDATTPVSATWQFGDGTTASGLTVSHAYGAPGTYTVTATATNRGGDSSESCLVTVVEPPDPPVLAGCRATPSEVSVGESVTIDATATDADEILVEFGDGETASTLPARHAYDEAGSYTVQITATNQYGTDTCTIPVTVGDTFCAEITELNPVFFGYRETTLTADAISRLEENIEILRRCPDICVTINAYSDGQEGDALRISQARADAVRDYYVTQGIDMDRLRAVGRGVAPDAEPKEDPGPGDSRARIATSIPSSCAGFDADMDMDDDDMDMDDMDG